MKIGIVATSYLSGAGVADLINQTQGLDEVDRENKYYIFLSKYQSFLLNELPSNFEKIIVPFLPRQALLRSVLNQIILPFYIVKHKIDQLYCFGNIAVFFVNVKTILLIQNASPFSRVATPSVYHRVSNKILAFITKLSAKKSDLILYVSENSRKLFNALLMVKDEKSRVVYHSWSKNKIIPLPNLIKAHPNILWVGSILPFKQLENLMAAFDGLVEKINYKGHLLIAGDITDKGYYEKLVNFQKTLASREKIQFLGRVQYKYMMWLYSQVEILVFTSIEETFGIPLIEAMGMGLPILAAAVNINNSTQNYFNPSKEICMDAALYYNPFNNSDLEEKMIKLLEDENLRKKIKLAASERIKDFEREMISRKLVDIFNGLKDGNCCANIID
ncbi:MAG: glycosyltransferase family 1 protein [Bacteroidales bacterium]